MLRSRISDLWLLGAKVQTHNSGVFVAKPRPTAPFDRQRITLLFCVFVVLALIYLFVVFWPAVVIPFAHHDDYYFWAYDNRG